MIRFLADENFNNDILRGLVRRLPELDIPRVQDVGLKGADDARVLDWATQETRIVLTHDVSTLIHRSCVRPHEARTRSVRSHRRATDHCDRRCRG